MADQDVSALQQAIQERWPQSHADSPKVKRYVGKFWDRQRQERKITAVVKGKLRAFDLLYSELRPRLLQNLTDGKALEMAGEIEAVGKDVKLFKEG